MKDLSIIKMDYMDKNKKHYKKDIKVKWTNLEISENLYDSKMLKIIHNRDGSKEKYYIKKTTKELIYAELEDLLVTIDSIKKDKNEFNRKDKQTLKELKTLKTYYEKYINKKSLVFSMHSQELLKVMDLQNKKQINPREINFDKKIVEDTYNTILNDINFEINTIEQKNKKHMIKQYEREIFKNINNLLKQDYIKQKKLSQQKEKELKEKIKEYDNSNRDSSQLRYDLQILKEKFNKRNLRNYKQKAIDFLYENGININTKHS